MRYLYITLLLLGLSRNICAEDAEPVQIPGYTPPKISPNAAAQKTQQSAQPSTPLNTQQSLPSSAPSNTQQSAPSSAPLNTQQSAPPSTSLNTQQSAPPSSPLNTQQSLPSSAPSNTQKSAQASASVQVKQMTANFLSAIRQCQPQNFDLTNMLAKVSDKSFNKMFSNFTYNIAILGYSGDSCHILTTMSLPGLIPNSTPVTTTMDCLISPSLMTDFAALSQLIMRDTQAGKQMQPDTKQLLAKWMPAFIKTCTMTFNGKPVNVPPQFFDPETYAPSNTAPNTQQGAPQPPALQSETKGQ